MLAVGDRSAIDESARAGPRRSSGIGILERSRPKNVAAAVVVAIVFMVGLYPGLSAKGPIYTQDELGYLGNARAMVGAGAPLTQGPMTFYYAGWSIFLAPLAYQFAESDPLVYYRAALVLAAAVGSVAVLPVAYSVRRVLGLSAVSAVVCSGIVMVGPAAAVNAGYALSERMAMLAFACFVAAAVYWSRAHSVLAAVTLGLSASFTFLVHGRFIAVPIITLAWFIFGMIGRNGRTKSQWLATAGGVSALLTAFLASRAMNNALLREIYAPGSGVGLSLPDSYSLHELMQLTLTLLGHAWYQTMAWAGLVLVGIGVALVRVSRAGAQIRQPVTVWLLAVASVFAVSVAGWFSHIDEARTDAVIYGRYTDGASFSLAALGLGALVWMNPRTRLRTLGLQTAATIGLVAGVALSRMGTAFAGGWYAPINIAGLLGWMRWSEGPGIPYLRIGLGVVSMLLVLTIAWMRSVSLALLLVAGFFVGSTVLAVHGVTRPFNAGVEPDSRFALVTEIEKLGAATVAYDVTRGMAPDYINAYQFWCPLVTMRRTENPRGTIGYLITGRSLPPGSLPALQLGAAGPVDEALWLVHEADRPDEPAR